MGDSDASAPGRITVYSVTGCPHCKAAKAMLGKLGVPMRDVDVGRHPELRIRVKEMTGRSTVPQIFFNGVYIGGNDDLQRLPPDELSRIVNMVKVEPVPADAPPIPDVQSDQEMLESSGESLLDAPFVCERDSLADVVLALKESNVIIGYQRRGLSIIKNAFSGAQLIGWLEKERSMARVEACEAGQGLLDKKYMVCVSGCVRGEGRGPKFSASDTLYRLLEHDPNSALNAGETPICAPLKADELSRELRELILNLFSEYLSADGKCVDYKAMSLSPVFERYCEMAVQLQRVEILALNREEKLAFFINTYNALVIHGSLRMGFPSSVWQRYRFFNYVSYLIGGEVYTLQDIENGVLRGNRKGVAQLLKPFSKTDPRLQVALPDAEPLIHFALNCGAKSCPPIKTYTPKDIDGQLRTAAEAFLENDDACVVDCGKGEVRLSQIFKWYKDDFGGTNEKLLTWVLEHMGESQKKKKLQSVVQSGNARVAWLPYDWGSNSSH